MKATSEPLCPLIIRLDPLDCAEPTQIDQTKRQPYTQHLRRVDDKPTMDQELNPDWVLVFQTNRDADAAKSLLKENGLGAITRTGSNKTVLLVVRLLGPVVGSRPLECAKQIPFHKLVGLVDKFPVPEDRSSLKFSYAAPFTPQRELNIIRRQFGDDVASVFDFSNKALSASIPLALLGLAVHYLYAESESARHLLLWAAFPGALYFYFEWHKTFLQQITPAKVGIKRSAYVNTEQGARGTFRSVYVVVAAAILMVYFLGLVLLLAVEIVCTGLYNGPFLNVIKLIPVGGNAVLVALYGLVYNLVVKEFTLIEDYPTEQEMEVTVSKRKFSLQIFISFVPVVLSVYLYEPLSQFLAAYVPSLVYRPFTTFVDRNPSFALVSTRLGEQARYFSVRQPLTGMATGIGLPFLLYGYKFLRTQDVGRFAREQLKPPFDVQTQLQTTALTFAFAYVLFPVWPFSFAAALLLSFLRTRLLLFSLRDYCRRPIESSGDSTLIYLRAVIPLSTFLAYSVAYAGGQNTAELATRGALLALISVLGITLANRFDDIPQVVRAKIPEYDDEKQDALWVST